MRLSKRRARAGVQSGTNAVLVVKHRDMNEKELEAQVSPPPVQNSFLGTPPAFWGTPLGELRPPALAGGAEGAAGEPRARGGGGGGDGG